MKAAEIISTLRSRGVELWQEGGALRYRARLGVLTDKEKAVLRTHRSAILRTLTATPTGPIAVTNRAPPAGATAATGPLPNRTAPPKLGTTTPFNKEALDAIKAGAGCWVWSGVLEEWCFWVRDQECRCKAVGRGIDAWRIWTLDELSGAQGMPPDDLRNVAQVKRQFSGTIQPGAMPAQWRDALGPLAPVVAAEACQ